MFGNLQQRIAVFAGVTVLVAALHCSCVAAGVTVVVAAASTHDCCHASEASKHATPIHSRGDSQSCLHCGGNAGALTKSADQVAAATWVREFAALASCEAAASYSPQVIARAVLFDGSPPGAPRTLFDLRSCLII